MESMTQGEWESTVQHIGQIADPYMCDLPALQKKMVMERVGRRVAHLQVSDMMVRQIVIEETRFVQACM